MKKLLYIFFTIVIVIFSSDKVYAAQPLTCVYSSSGIKPYAIMLIQKSDGSHKIKRHYTDCATCTEKPAISSKAYEGWQDYDYKVEFSNDEELTSCPEYLDYKASGFLWLSTTLVFQDNETNYPKYYEKDYDIEEETQKNEQEGIDQTQHFEKGYDRDDDNNKCSQDSKYKVCPYGNVTICFNEKEWDTEITDKANAGITDVNLNFTLSEFLAEYNKTNSCPSNLYSKPSANGLAIEISLDNFDGNLIQEEPYEEYEPADIYTELPDITDCSLLLGAPNTEGSPAFYLLKAFHVIKYVALVLLVVLSVMDFTGAIAKQDKDVMAKILKKLMLRFILCIIIFLLPSILNILLNYLVDRQTNLCGIK